MMEQRAADRIDDEFVEGEAITGMRGTVVRGGHTLHKRPP
jgi:hypothetical protein